MAGMLFDSAASAASRVASEMTVTLYFMPCSDRIDSICAERGIFALSLPKCHNIIVNEMNSKRRRGKYFMYFPHDTPNGVQQKWRIYCPIIICRRFLLSRLQYVLFSDDSLWSKLLLLMGRRGRSKCTTFYIILHFISRWNGIRFDFLRFAAVWLVLEVCVCCSRRFQIEFTRFNCEEKYENKKMHRPH